MSDNSTAKALAEALRSSDWDKASELLESQLAEHPADMRALAQMTSVSLRRQDWRRAIRSGAEEARLQPDHLPVLKKQLMLLLKYGDDTPGADDFKASLDIATRILALSPADGPLLRIAGQAFARARLNGEAARVLRLAASYDASDPITFTILADVFRREGDYTRSAGALSELVQIKPSDPDAWRALSSAWNRAGRSDEAKNAFVRSVELRSPHVSGDFATGLAALHGHPVKIGRARLDWAWRLQVEAGSADPTRARSEWDARAQWSADADQFLLDWLEVNPGSWEKIADLTEIAGIDQLSDCLRAGQGAYVAIAHLGPVMGMPCALLRSGLPFRWVSSAPAAGGGPVYQRLVSTKDMPAKAALFPLHATLTKGAILLAAADSGVRREAYTPFEGQLIPVNETGARLAHWLHARCFFLDGRWSNGRMKFEVLPMAQAGCDENAESFVERWKSDYLARIGSIIRSAPENLKCRGGLWSNIREAKDMILR